MFLFGKPDHSSIASFLGARTDDRYSYDAVGSTRQKRVPDGFIVDHNRVDLGRGEDTFETAKQAIRNWKMFDLGWVEIYEPTTPIEPSQTVAILISHLGFYSLNAARIVYKLDENEGNVRKFGFAYGTLTEHGEIGEERFSVEHDLSSDIVTYDLFAFSRPGHLLAKLGYPLARHFQRRFGTDSKAAMVRAVDLKS